MEKVLEKYVFSTYVEMIPTTVWILSVNLGVLHVCGDDPMRYVEFWDKFVCSPRMWR